MFFINSLSFYKTTLGFTQFDSVPWIFAVNVLAGLNYLNKSPEASRAMHEHKNYENNTLRELKSLKVNLLLNNFLRFILVEVLYKT